FKTSPTLCVCPFCASILSYPLSILSFLSSLPFLSSIPFTSTMPPPRRLGRPPLTASQRQESDRRNAERHAAYMRERRSDPEYRQLEQAANSQQRARARQDDQYREREQAARNQARQDEEYRSRERSMDAQRRARARQDNEYRRREQEANTQQRALA